MIWFGAQNEAFVTCKIEIMANMFDSFFVEKTGLVRKFCLLMDGKQSIRACICSDEIEFINN